MALSAAASVFFKFAPGSGEQVAWSRPILTVELDEGSIDKRLFSTRRADTASQSASGSRSRSRPQLRRRGRLLFERWRSKPGERLSPCVWRRRKRKSMRRFAAMPKVLWRFPSCGVARRFCELDRVRKRGRADKAFPFVDNPAVHCHKENRWPDVARRKTASCGRRLLRAYVVPETRGRGQCQCRGRT